MPTPGFCPAWRRLTCPPDPEKQFDGFWGACSTYGSFSYLKYGMFRLFSQLAQDCQWKIGKVIWVAGHSGPETADDSRTHFGIFAPGVTQLFPEGTIINLQSLGVQRSAGAVGRSSASKMRPSSHCTSPARRSRSPTGQALGMPSHFEAARGAYMVRDYQPGLPKGGTFFVQGTSAMASILKVLPELDSARPERKDSLCSQPAAIRSPAGRLPQEDRLARRSGQLHGDYHPGALADARLAVQ